MGTGFARREWCLERSTRSLQAGPMAKLRSDLMVWLDMEMTGLDVERERVIELAIVLTDSNLEWVADGPELVIHQSDELLAQMDEWNTEHHNASGLVERVRSSQVTEAQAEATVLEFLEQHTRERSAPLAGNSVWQDRRFLAKYFPRADKHLHYRIIDVSTVKELARRWAPGVADAAPRKGDQHRALDDIRESIEELRYFRGALGWGPGDDSAQNPSTSN